MLRGIELSRFIAANYQSASTQPSEKLVRREDVPWKCHFPLDAGFGRIHETHPFLVEPCSYFKSYPRIVICCDGFYSFCQATPGAMCHCCKLPDWMAAYFPETFHLKP